MQQDIRSSPAAAQVAPGPGAALDPDAAISIRGLVKRYGEFVAVDGLDLDIRRGEIFALLGPNGAGKTTTVEICEGYRSRDAGEVRVLGEDPADGKPARGRPQLGIVLQSGSGDSQLTCRELLTAQASYYADPRDPDEVLELVGLTEKAGVRGRTLSGGQRRRLDVALGIVGRPDAAVPGRADDRVRSRGAAAVLVADPVAARAGHHDAAHHPLPGRGRGAGRPGGGHRPRPAGRGRRPGGAGRPGDRAGRGQLDRGRRPADRGRRATPTAFVRELAARFPGEVPDLAVARPTLEDVYLRMIGEPS